MSADAGDAPKDRDPVVLTPVAPSTGGVWKVQHMMYAVAASAFAVWLGTVAGVWVVILGMVTVIIGAVSLAVVFVRQGRAQQEALSWALAIAAERSMPLAPAALAFADQYGPFFRRRVRRLAALLDDGATLPEALDRTWGLFSPEGEVLARAGWKSARLGDGLRMAAGLRSARQSAWGAIAWQFVYLEAVLLVMQGVTSFILYFIAPKFEAVFADFGLPLPEFTVLTIQLGHWITGWGGIPLALLLLAELVAMAVVPLGLFGVFHWDIPLTDYLFRRRHSALIFRALSLTTRGGRPIPEGIDTLARDYPSGWVRRRLRGVSAAVRRGGDWVDGLRDALLIGPADAAVIAAALRVGNLPWALSELAESNERRTGYRLQFWLQMIFPVVTLALGAVVFVMAVAYFSPLVLLIERLAG